MILKDEAIALRVYPFGNTSQIAVWLSRTYGKLATLAKGSQRAKSPFLGQFDLFMTKIEQAAGAATDARERAGAAAAAAPSTPVTNRGVTPSQAKGRKSAPGKASSRSVSPRSSSKKSGG